MDLSFLNLALKKIISCCNNLWGILRIFLLWFCSRLGYVLGGLSVCECVLQKYVQKTISHEFMEFCSRVCTFFLALSHNMLIPDEFVFVVQHGKHFCCCHFSFCIHFL